MSNKWEVGYWMRKLPQTISPTMSTREAFNKMRSGSFRHLLVVQDGQLLGLVSDRDLRRPDLSKGEDGWNALYTPNEEDEVRYIMATELQTIRANDHIHKAVKILAEYRYGALPVINDQDNPIGILSIYDLLKSFDEILDKCGSRIEFQTILFFGRFIPPKHHFTSQDKDQHMPNNNPCFTTQTMWEIYRQLRPHFDKEYITFEVVNPDLAQGVFNGEMQTLQNINYRYRSHKAWLDFAEIIDYHYLTPQNSDYPFIKIRYQRLNQKNSWHLNQKSLEEKYGCDSLFARIDKLEEPAFLMEYADCLRNCRIAKNMRILGLGVNEGKEFKLFSNICDPETYDSLQFLGIDLVKSSIDKARSLFPQNHEWMVDDIGNWQKWNIGKFDVLIAIGIFHSPSLNGKNIITPLLKKFLHNNSRIILGFPNVRYIDGEIKFGAKSKNYEKPEWSLLLKDIGYYRRLLFRQGFNVTVTGKYYLFVTGIKQ